MKKLVPVIVVGLLCLVGCSKDAAEKPQVTLKSEDPFGLKEIQRSARLSDGIALLGEIKYKQDVFYNIYSAYESSTTDETTFDGQKLHGVHFGFYRWDSDCAADAQTSWCRLGFNPTLMQADGESRLLYFQLQTIGYSAKTKDNPPSFINNPEDRWLSVQARYETDDECVLLRLTNEQRDIQKIVTRGTCSKSATVGATLM